jgi:hypothetical protein
MCSCKRATELLGDAMNRKLSFGERVSLRFHLFVCGACRRYRQQIEIIRQALKNGSVGDLKAAADHELSLGSEARERIRNAMAKNL